MKENYQKCKGCEFDGHCQIQDSDGPDEDCQWIMRREVEEDEEEN